MRRRIYMVFDLVAGQVVGSPVLEVADAPAIRGFHDALSAKDSMLAKHAADFDLLWIGEIADEGTIFGPYSAGGDNVPRVTVARGAQWAAAQQLEAING